MVSLVSLFKSCSWYKHGGGCPCHLVTGGHLVVPKLSLIKMFFGIREKVSYVL